MWRFAVLEIYRFREKWPAEGTPADWIENKQVLYAQSTPRELSWTIPLLTFLWWKFIDLLSAIKDFFEFSVWRRIEDLLFPKKRLIKDYPVVDDDWVKENLGVDRIDVREWHND